jgi:hypothetical protein
MLSYNELNSLQCLIDFLGQVSQILCTDRLYNDLLLIAQCERLSKISVCQGCLRLPEQRLTKLVTDHRSCKETMQAITLGRRFVKAEGGSSLGICCEHHVIFQS